MSTLNFYLESFGSKHSFHNKENYIEEYWHGTIKNYRYDGDVSASPSLIPARP